ncbi:MAG: ABC transporter substrate-binding protein [Actinomycetota bacterium]|nr:ABC transporter substrate-binding protein [Actinomycetota bacterium]
MNRRPALLVALAAALSLGLVGCSSTPETPAPTSSEPAPDTSTDAEPTDAEPTEVETRSITVGALPISETAPLWAAVKAGVFADHGLDVTVQPIQGGAQAMPALLNGDVDFMIGQPFGALRASLQGLDVKIISNYAESFAEGDDINAVVAGADSGISRPAELAGKRVAVNSLGAAGDLTIMEAVKKDGGDPSTITFIEVAFPDAGAQIEANNIDAAWVPEPFVSMIVGAGGSKVVYPYQATLPGLPTLMVQTTGANVTNDAALVADFRAALAEAFAWAADNDDLVRQSLVDEMSLPEPAAAGLPLPNFTTEIDRDVLQGLADLAIAHGFFDEAPDLGALIAE